MKVSYQWLAELIPDLTLTPAEVADTLTLHSFETVIDHEFKLDPNITVVEILNVEPHPNADKLRLATVTDGQQEIKVVCGAPNIAIGQKVPFSPPGTFVRDKDGQLFELTVATIRGVESPGMLNSRRELGLGEDHDGIFILPNEVVVGSKLADHMPSDTVLEADITSNRAHDCLSHLGIARELAAILKLAVKEPTLDPLPAPQETVQGMQVAIQDSTMVPRYMGLVVTDVKDGISPLWMQHRLIMSGIKPHSAIVDITNVVMLEIGNPSHAFDLKKLPGKTMGVRVSKSEETLTLLDGKTLSLPTDALVVTCDDQPVALAGIMGGAGTEVSPETSTLLLEVATFHPYTIQKTATAVSLRTEAATRFLKGLEPQRAQVAAARLSYLLQMIAHGKVEGLLDVYPTPYVSPKIIVSSDAAAKAAGVAIDTAEAIAILQRLRMEVHHLQEGIWEVIPPTDRLDMTGPHDVVEEIIRMVGLTNIPSTIPTGKEKAVALPHQVAVREALRNQLVVAGFTETYSYSFEPEKEVAVLGISSDDHIEVTNPVAPSLRYLRTSLLPGLVAAMIKNKAEFLRSGGKRERALFEVGHVYRAGDGGQVPGVIETEIIAGICIGNPAETIQQIVSLLNATSVTVSKEATPTSWGKSYAIQAAEKNIGYIGTFSSQITKKMKYLTTVGVFEIDMAAVSQAIPDISQSPKSLADIQAETSVPVQFTELNKFPSVFRDLSILAEADVHTDAVQEVIERVGGENLIDTELFDEYEPDSDSQDDDRENKKSLAFHLEYSAKDRTLTDKEVGTMHAAIEEALKKELDAEVK